MGLLDKLDLVASLLALVGAFLGFASLVLVKILRRVNADARKTEYELKELLARIRGEQNDAEERADRRSSN